MPAATTKYGFPYQLAADPPEGNEVGQDLAEAVEGTLEAAFVPLTNQRTTTSSGITSTTLVEVLTVTLPAAGTYVYDLQLVITQTVSAGRPAFALGGTSTATAWRWVAGSAPDNSATGLQGSIANGTTYPAPTSGTALTNSDWAASSGFAQVTMKGTVTVSAAGTLTFRLSATVAGTVTCREGSMVVCHRIP